jgi:hypothetical protein
MGFYTWREQGRSIWLDDHKTQATGNPDNERHRLALYSKKVAMSDMIKQRQTSNRLKNKAIKFPGPLFQKLKRATARILA